MTRTSAPPADLAHATEVLQIHGIQKSFGSTRAIEDATFGLRRGEIHAIVGENGSGKSTLVKILTGIHRPDGGRLLVDGQATDGFAGPRAASNLGIVGAFQEVLVIPAQTVVDNVCLGVDSLARWKLSKTEKLARTGELLQALLGRELPPRAPVGSLSLSERQACGIARALIRRPRLLILDEATSALDIDTRNRLFDILRANAARGQTTLFISHRMDEIHELADRVTVMRSGRTVDTLANADASTDRLVGLMTNSDRLVPSQARRQNPAAGAQIVCVDRVRLRPDRPEISLQIHAGELIGLAGLEGQGQDEFLKRLAREEFGSGRVLWQDGADGPNGVPANGQTVAYLPRERRVEGLFDGRSVIDNFAIASLAADTRYGIISKKRVASRFAPYAQRLKITLNSPHSPITTLSGGNQQKVAIARWLATKPRLLLLNDPTRGVDLNAKRDIYALLGELAAEGMAIVMLSTEVDEHVELMDRVLVFHDQSVVTCLSRGQVTREALVSAFFAQAPA